jgi:hypothetical protein
MKMDINEIEEWHPKLISEKYKIITTDKNLDDFNCVAYVLDVYTDWYGSTTKFWHNDNDRVPSLENYIKYFETYSYELCEDDSYEEEFNKIAIYINKKSRFTHVARQYEKKWQSKIGPSYIIEHELEWLTGYDADNYGEIGAILRRIK